MSNSWNRAWFVAKFLTFVGELWIEYGKFGNLGFSKCTISVRVFIFIFSLFQILDWWMSNKARIKRARQCYTWFLSTWTQILRNSSVAFAKLEKLFLLKLWRYGQFIFVHSDKSLFFLINFFLSVYYAELDVPTLQRRCFLPWAWNLAQVLPYPISFEQG